MHSIKCGWVGQTFAMATCNDSGGKKSRIRRSKEERKTMVESFIKKYQKLNNGNFPSLNLTHKEVGGSFYTVREIVREIIQENRVLGPAKLQLEEASNNDLMEPFPLGSLALQPSIHSPIGESDVVSHVECSQYPVENGDGLLIANEHQGLNFKYEKELVHHPEAVEANESASSQVAVGYDQCAKIELLSESAEQFYRPEHLQMERAEHFGNSMCFLEDGTSDEPILLSIPEDQKEINQESHQRIIAGQVPQSCKRNEELRCETGQVFDYSLSKEKISDSQVPLPTVMIVEESLVSEGEQINNVDALHSEICKTVVVETFPLRPVTHAINGLEGISDNQHEKENLLENFSSPIDVGVRADLPYSIPEKMDRNMDEKESLNNGYLSSESSDCLTTGGTVALHGDNFVLTETEIPTLTKPVDGPKDINYGNIGGVDTKTPHEQTVVELASGCRGELNYVKDISGRKESSSTLDRTKLETWDGKSKKRSGNEIKALLALFKAFVTALVKFFTE